MAPPGTDVGPPTDALPVTATAGRDRLPVGRPGVGRPAVVVGSKDFPEQTLLGELYVQALAAKGYTVSTRPDIGSSEVIDTAMTSNEIQMYPEYLGEIVTSVAQQPAPGSASETYTRARTFEEVQRGATLLRQTPFQDTDAVAVTRRTAEQYGLDSVADLGKIASGGAGVTIAAKDEFSRRQTGLLGVQDQYGLHGLRFSPVAAGEQYHVLDSGAAITADVFTTDAALQSGKYKVLADPRNVFGFQYVAPVVKQSVLAEQGPGFAATCDWVSSLLTTRTVQALNGEVQLGGASPAGVARQFLATVGLE